MRPPLSCVVRRDICVAVLYDVLLRAVLVWRGMSCVCYACSCVVACCVVVICFPLVCCDCACLCACSALLCFAWMSCVFDALLSPWSPVMTHQKTGQCMVAETRCLERQVATTVSKRTSSQTTVTWFNVIRHPERWNDMRCCF